MLISFHKWDYINSAAARDRREHSTLERASRYSGAITNSVLPLDSVVVSGILSQSRGGLLMPHYVSLLRYTHQGAAKIKESPARLDAAKKAAEAAQGKVHAWYLTMGEYDAVLVSEFPNDEAAARFMLSTGALGNVTTQTLKAFTEAEYRKIVASLP
jgi:uncharacterized protein with GYD domain